MAGEGIGPEVIGEAMRVLEALRSKDFDFEATSALFGGVAYEKLGHPLPDATLRLAQDADAVLCGAVGDPRFDHLERSLRPEQGLLGIRKNLRLFASLRQIEITGDLAQLSPLKPDLVAGLDVLVVRELAGDVYFGEPRGERISPDGVFAGDREGYDTMRYAEREVRRIAHVGFKVAVRRGKRLCNVDKANVLETSRFWRSIVNDVAKDYPNVVLSHMFADNAVMQMMSRPKAFDTILTSNLFGDILSDAASVLTGSVGLPASAMLSDGGPGVYEPGHGTAFDIAGKDLANPIATIRAAALMLRHSLNQPHLADRVEAAVNAVLQSGLRTQDIQSPGCTVVGTRAMGDAIVAALH